MNERKYTKIEGSITTTEAGKHKKRGVKDETKKERKERGSRGSQEIQLRRKEAAEGWKEGRNLRKGGKMKGGKDKRRMEGR